VGIVRLSLSEILNANSKQFPSASSVEFSLHKLCGILAVQVDRGADKIELRYDLSVTSAENMIQSLSNMNISTQNKCIVHMDPMVSLRAKESGDRSSGSSGYKSATTGSPTRTTELLFSVRGMSCANCAAKVEKHLLKQSIVRSASVSSMTNKAKVVLKESVNDVDMDVESPEGITRLEELVCELEKQIQTLGYACEWIKPLNLSGSPSQSKNLCCLVMYSRHLFHLPNFCCCCFLKIKDKKRKSDASGDGEDELDGWWKLMCFSLFFGVPVLFLHLAMAIMKSRSMSTMHMTGEDSANASNNFFMHPVPLLCHGTGITTGQAIMVSLNLPVLFIVGGRYYKSAIVSAMHCSYGMDFLVMTGSSVTFLYSIVQLLYSCHHGEPAKHVFFEAIGMLLMFVTVGKYIEAYAKGKSAQAITTLLKLQPKKVINCKGDTMYIVYIVCMV
jgi:cation transport ATPase